MVQMLEACVAVAGGGNAALCASTEGRGVRGNGVPANLCEVDRQGQLSRDADLR